LTIQNVSVPADARWRKASRSTASNNCVEVAAVDGAAAIRDSKNREGGHLTIGPGAWEAFLSDVKRGRYERP
jgi:hypothetical protein